MSTVASRPASIANSFYESERRLSIEPTNKIKELARAIGREKDGLMPSFRPPSSWTQRSSHHDVVWTGDQDHDHNTNDDQFSDAESWDGDAQKTFTADLDSTASVYGHIRPTSIGSSIFAGRGAKSERRRREVAPPLPNLAASHHHQQSNALHGSDTGLLSPAPHNMHNMQSLQSPRSDASGFDSSSQYSGYDGKSVTTDHADLADGFDIQNSSISKNQSLPPRNSSKNPPPIPVKAASRGSNESPRRSGSTADADNSPTRNSAPSNASTNRLPDGLLMPKMPPVPMTEDLTRSRKPNSRRERSPVLSFDGGAAEEERLLVELQSNLANDPRRVSTLGPKVKKNAPAPWELGGEDVASTAGRPSLREALRPSTETFEKPFSRFKSRPSIDASMPGPKSPIPPQVPSGLAHASHPSNVASLEPEMQKQDDAHSAFANQRSRSKSVSSSAVGMLKGLGLAGAATPASKKGKLTKALRLVGAGGSSQPSPSPLPERIAPVNGNPTGSCPAAPIGFASELPQSRSMRHLNGANSLLSATKSQADLASMIMATNSKFRDQACSPPLPSPNNSNASLPSPHIGGTRSLGYRKDTLSPIDTSTFAAEQSHFANSMDRARSHTPPTRQLSVASHLATSIDDIAPRSSSLEDEQALGSTPAEGESTPMGKASAVASTSQPRNSSPSTHQTGRISASSSQTSVSLPMPGNIEGVPYKLISLQEAREQARQKQSEWLASSGATTAVKPSPSPSPYLGSGDAAHDETGLQRDASSDGQSSLRLLKNKKSGFLMRKLKKDKGISIDLDGVSTFPTSGSNRDLARSSKSPMPSFSVTGMEDEEGDELKPLTLLEKPALQIRPVSSMFSGFAPDFLDAAALSEGHLREASNSSSTSSNALLTPHSPVSQTFRTASPASSQSGRFTPSSSSNKPQLAEIRPPPHGSAVPGPAVPGSADSNWSGLGGASGISRLPSLDAGASSSDTQSQFHSPANSPLTPSFHQSVHGTASSHNGTTPLIEETAAFSPPPSPQIPEEVRQRAREIEAQIQELCNELHELRVKHVGQGTAPTFRPSVADDGEQPKEHQATGNCPSCGCGCAEHRRLQSINEAAVLKGISVLDRGRALKPSSNMGNTGKFGGYTNR